MGDGSMYECEGLNGGKVYTNGNGKYYALHVEKKNEGVKYLRCRIRKCRGGAKIVRTNDSEQLIEIGDHSEGCVPDMFFEKMVELKKSILKRAEQETTPLINIFNEECNRVTPEVAATLTYNQILSTMKRARKKHLPRIPSDYAEYERNLEGRFGDSEGRQYYFQRVGEGDEECMLFVVDPIKHILEQSEELHFDGTFKVVPNEPSSRQLFSILAMKNDHAFPVVFCLMKTKTANAYCTVLNLLKQRYPGMKPKLIISDYEASIKYAVKQIFPESIHKGCWFHFTQSIFKKIQKCGLANEYYHNNDVQKAVRMLMCLALLPESMILNAFTDVEAFCRGQNVYDSLQEIFTYFRTQWIERVGCSSFSVYGQPRRTNNCQEGFHHMFFSILGKAHPNIWEFTEALRTVAGTAVRDSFRLENRGGLTLGRRRKWILQDMRINNAQESLVLGRMAPIDFLRQMTHHLTSHARLRTVGEEEDDLATLPDHLPVHSVPLEENNDSGFPEQNMQEERQVRRRGRGRGRGRGMRLRGPGPFDRPPRRGQGRGVEHEVVELLGDPVTDERETPPLQPTPAYQNYRIIPTKLITNEFMSVEDIVQQKEEITMGLNVFDEGESVSSEGHDACPICLNFVATRLCSPCGHKIACRSCAINMANTDFFHEVTGGDGAIIVTHIRLPLRCPICRSIMGLLVKAF